MNYHIYLDDSGVLSNNYPVNFFVYGGLLLEDSNIPKVKASFSKALSTAKQKWPYVVDKKTNEIKASKISNKQNIRNHLLYSIQSNCKHIFIIVKIDEIDQNTMADKKNIVRYKNYALRILMERLLKGGYIENNSKIYFQIDDQNTAVSAEHNLEEYLNSYFSVDIKHDDLFKCSHFNVLDINISVKITYTDSAKNELVQAADILANTKFRKFCVQNCLGHKMLQSDCFCVKLPKNNYSSGKT